MVRRVMHIFNNEFCIYATSKKAKNCWNEGSRVLETKAVNINPQYYLISAASVVSLLTPEKYRNDLNDIVHLYTKLSHKY